MTAKSASQPAMFFSQKNQVAVLSASQISLSELVNCQMDDLEDGIWNPKTSNPVEVRAWIRIHVQLQHMCIMDNY
jgi:hypothetical protein